MRLSRAGGWMVGCEFSLKTLVIAVKKDFRQGLDQGIKQVSRLMLNDLRTRAEEILRPEAAYFLTPIETRINLLTGKEDLYWQGYRRSIDESMRRNIALLKVQGVAKEKIDQAIVERKTWQMIRDKSLGLSEGEGIQFMALKTTNPTDGVALQQLSKRNGQLVLESQLLPFDQINQIGNFREFLGEKRDDISLIPEESGVDPIVSWAVQGEAVDFQKELPELIDQAQKLPQSDFLLEEFKQRQQFSEMFPATIPTRLDFVGKLPELEIPVQVSSEAGFWFEAMAVSAAAADQNIIETSMQVFADQSIGSHLVGRKEEIKVTSGLESKVSTKKKKMSKREVIVFKVKKTAIVIDQQSRRTDLVGSKKEEKKIIVKPKIEISRLVWQRKEKKLVLEKVKQVELVLEKQAEKKEERRRENKPVAKTIIWQRQAKQLQKVRMKMKPINQKERKNPAEQEIPIWQVKLNPAEAKEIPWWQPNLSASIELIEAERIVVLTIFFLIVNKKRLRKMKIVNF